MTYETITRLIDVFISYEDTSIDAANNIEIELDDIFPEDDYIQETIEMLAMYKPGGGEFLLDVDSIRERLIATRGTLWDYADYRLFMVTNCGDSKLR